ISSTNGYRFDSNTENGPGVRTLATSGTAQSYAVTAENAFVRVTSETRQPNTENLGWTYDNLGEALARTSSLVTTGTQAMTWDSFGRLIKVSKRDNTNSGYNWSAVYDGLGRRLKTVSQPITSGTNSGSVLTLN